MPASTSPGASFSSRRWLRAAGVCASVCALVCVLVALRLLGASRAELRLGEARLQAGDPVAAIAHWERAARLHVSGSPYSRQARERLVGEARTAPDPALRLRAWRALHAALLATASPLPRGASESAQLAEARAHISELAAALESPAVDPGASEAERARWYAARLTALEHDEPLPSSGGLLSALAGLLLLLGAALVFFRFSLDEYARLRRPALLRSLGPALGMVSGLLLFLYALARR